MKKTAPAPKVVKAAKPKKAPKMPGSGIFQVLLTDLVDAPDLAHVPTLKEAAAMDDERSGPFGDWFRLKHNIKAAGRLHEPLKVCAIEGGKWQVLDGRSRRAAAEELWLEGEKQFVRVPCLAVRPEDAESLVTQSLARRMVPVYVLAYLECLRHEGQLLARRRGRPSKQIPADDIVGQSVIAETLDCARSVVSSCVSALRFFADHPADRERDEPRILAGLMDPERVIHAATGRAATAGQPRNPSSYETWWPKLRSMGSTIREFADWPVAARQNAAIMLKKSVADWPLEFCDLLRDVLEANDTIEITAEEGAAES